MGATRDKIYKSFEKKKAIDPKLKKKINKLNKENLDYLRVGDKIVRPRTTPKPPVSSYSATQKRPAAAPIKKATFGFGKDSAGKPRGTTTVVDLGKNPTAADKIKGARMARNQKPTRGTTPQAKAPTTSSAYVNKDTRPPKTWKPANVSKLINKQPSVMVPMKPAPAPKAQDRTTSNAPKSFSARGIATAIATSTMAATGALKLATPPKRNKSAAITAAKARKPLTTPKAPKIKARHIDTPRVTGAEAQADPTLKARSDRRRAAEGSKLKQAGYGKPKAPAPAAAPKPRSILELEEPKPVTTPKTPTAATAPTKRPTQAAPAKRPGVVQSIRNALTPQAVHDEIRASQRAKSKTVAAKVEAPDNVPIDTTAEVEKAKAQAAELEGRLKRAVKAPGRAAQKVTGAATSTVTKVKQGVKDALDPNIAETRAARKAKATPAVEPVEFEDLTPDQRHARQKELEARIETGRSRQEAAAAKKAKAPKTTADKFGATEADVQKVAASAETTKAPTEQQKAANRAALADAPKDVQDLAKRLETPPVSAETKKLQSDLAAARKESEALGGSEAKKKAAAPADADLVAKELETAKKRAADLMKQVEAAEVASTATETSVSATDAEATKAAATGETPAEMKKRKRAAQKFYDDKSKRLEAQGSVRKGTSTAVNPAVVGAKPKAEVETPTPQKRRPTEDLIKEQGVEVQKVAPKEAPEADATTEEWDKKRKNAEATRTPVEQAKLDAKELGIQISETEANRGTLGAKLKEAAGITPEPELFATETAQRPITETGTGWYVNEQLNEIHERREAEQERREASTRREQGTRFTQAEAVEAGIETPGAKKGSRREKQTGGDRRQKGSEWKPVDISEELAKNLRPGGGPDRRGPSLTDLDVNELKDSAARGDVLARETLKQYQEELKGRGKERRATDTAGREAAKLALDIERAEAGIGKTESTLTWDPKAKHPRANPQMNVEADLMPEAKVYSGDPIKATTLEDMNKRIAGFEKRLKKDPNVVYQAEETLEKLKRQRDGLAQEVAKDLQTRQFPSKEAQIAEQAVKEGEKVIPRTEARKHVRGPTGERNVLVPGTPQQRKTATPRGPIEEPRTRPHVGPARGKITIPAPDLSVGKAVERERPADWVKEDPKMWEKSLERAGHTPPPLTSPAIGSNVGENIWDAVKRAAKNPKVRGIAGLGFGLGVGTAAFLVPDVASAYVDAAGDQRNRIKAAGGQALESGIEVGGSMAAFTGGLWAAQKVASAALKPLVGAAGHAAGSAAIGYVAGTAAGGIYNRVKAVREKNIRDTAHAQKKYGTVEAATRTRKGLKADGTPMTLDDTEDIARRWEREQAKLKKSRSGDRR